MITNVTYLFYLVLFHVFCYFGTVGRLTFLRNESVPVSFSHTEHENKKKPQSLHLFRNNKIYALKMLMKADDKLNLVILYIYFLNYSLVLY